VLDRCPRFILNGIRLDWKNSQIIPMKEKSSVARTSCLEYTKNSLTKPKEAVSQRSKWENIIRRTKSGRDQLLTAIEMH
jgi:hypothetical protein